MHHSCETFFAAWLTFTYYGFPACVLNAISHDTAFCLYPRATLEDRSTLMLRADELLDEAIYRKFVHRGYQFVLTSRPGDPAYPYDTLRRLDDRHTWRISLASSLDTSSIPLRSHQPPVLSKDSIFMSSWTLQKEPCLRIVFDVHSYPSFYHAYVADEEVVALACGFINAVYCKLAVQKHRL